MLRVFFLYTHSNAAGEVILLRWLRWINDETKLAAMLVGVGLTLSVVVIVAAANGVKFVDDVPPPKKPGCQCCHKCDCPLLFEKSPCRNGAVNYVGS